MFTKVQKELINDLLDLFQDFYRNVNWHQTNVFLTNIEYDLNRSYKSFMIWLRFYCNHGDCKYIANKLYNSIIKMCKNNH